MTKKKIDFEKLRTGINHLASQPDSHGDILKFVSDIETCGFNNVNQSGPMTHGIVIIDTEHPRKNVFYDKHFIDNVQVGVDTSYSIFGPGMLRDVNIRNEMMGNYSNRAEEIKTTCPFNYLNNIEKDA